MTEKKPKKVCVFCWMMRFFLLFFAVVAVFLMNGLYHFWN